MRAAGVPVVEKSKQNLAFVREREYSLLSLTAPSRGFAFLSIFHRPLNVPQFSAALQRFPSRQKISRRCTQTPNRGIGSYSREYTVNIYAKLCICYELWQHKDKVRLDNRRQWFVDVEPNIKIDNNRSRFNEQRNRCSSKQLRIASLTFTSGSFRNRIWGESRADTRGFVARKLGRVVCDSSRNRKKRADEAYALIKTVDTAAWQSPTNERLIKLHVSLVDCARTARDSTR